MDRKAQIELRTQSFNVRPHRYRDKSGPTVQTFDYAVAGGSKAKLSERCNTINDDTDTDRQETKTAKSYDATRNQLGEYYKKRFNVQLQDRNNSDLKHAVEILKQNQNLLERAKDQRI